MNLFYRYPRRHAGQARKTLDQSKEELGVVKLEVDRVRLEMQIQSLVGAVEALHETVRNQHLRCEQRINDLRKQIEVLQGIR